MLAAPHDDDHAMGARGARKGSGVKRTQKRAYLIEAARMIAENEQDFSCTAVRAAQKSALPSWTDPLAREYARLFAADSDDLQAEIYASAPWNNRRHFRVMLLLIAAEVLE